MAIGPFTTYAPPGVYTRTLAEPPTGQIINGLRVPVLIGTGQEALSQDNVEIVRGSSSSADTPVFNEDTAGRWVTGGPDNNPTLGDQDGNLFRFKVRNFPIVDGNGTGTTTFEANKVTITVNGTPVVASAVDGVNGIITLLIAPRALDTVLASYFFNRSDTLIKDDLSDQVTVGSAVLTAPKAQLYEIIVDINDELTFFVNDSTTELSVTLVPGSKTAVEVANEVNSAALPGLSAVVSTDNQGLSHVRFTATNNILIGSGSAAGALGFNVGDFTNREKDFRTFQGPIVDGAGGGIATTDPTKVTATVDAVQVVVSAVDGQNQVVTLEVAPPSGSLVEIEYFFNTFQDTFDFLPNNNITEVGNVGIAPGRRDFLNGPDFIVINQDDQSIIQWGTAFQVKAGETTGLLPFDGTQILGQLVDNRIFAVATTRFTDPTTNQVSATQFTLPVKPTTGNGRDTPLGQSVFQTVTNGRIDLPTDRPDLVIAFVGKNIRDALARPAVTVTAVDSVTNRITLKNPIAADDLVFATAWYNTIADDTYTLTVLAPGATGVGTYQIGSQVQNKNLLNTKFGVKTALPQTVEFPSGSELFPDAIHFGGFPVPETATVTFSTVVATHAEFTALGQEPYDVFAANSSFASIIIDGAAINAGAGVDLATAFQATLIGQPVLTPGALTFAATDRIALEIDGFNQGSVDISAATTLTLVATAINTQTHIALANEIKAKYNAHLVQPGVHVADDTANPVATVDATDQATSETLLNDLQTAYNLHLVEAGVHANDDTANTSVAAAASDLITAIALANELKSVFNAHLSEFLVGAGGNVHLVDDTINFITASDAGLAADIITYGTEEILRIVSFGAPTSFMELSKVAVRSPVGPGETDASTLVGLEPNLEIEGSVSAINQAAELPGGNVGPFNITAGVTDTFRFNIDGTDHTTTLPQDIVTTTAAVVTHINATTASAADTTTATTDLVALAVDLDTEYTLHIAITPLVHLAADVVNGTSTTPTDLASSITFLNELKAAFNAHRIFLTVHPFADTSNVITSPDATDLASAAVLANEAKERFNDHREWDEAAGNVHSADDVTSVVAAADVAFATPVAFVGIDQYLGRVVLQSFINTPDSLVQVQSGNANSALGFNNNTNRFRTNPDASAVATSLNADTGFIAAAVAYRIEVPGLGGYLNIRSLTTGTTSTIAFGGAAGSVFIDDTGFDIEIGVSGDVGEAPESGFDVTSSDAVSGSSGSGVPGQTYTDARTGLRFTILEASAGDYAPGGSFTFLISTVFVADAAIPTKAVPGIEVTVTNTLNMAVGTTGILTTFRRTGSEPQIGDVYFASYKFAKTDLSTALFQDLKKIQQNFGVPTPENPLSLAARLTLLNGAVIVGLKQVLREPNSGQASVPSYTEAIDEQKTPLPGGINQDIIVPLSTDSQVFAFLNQHCIFMGAPRQAAERIGLVGTAVGTTPLGVQSIAKGLNSELMMVMYPDSYVITTEDIAGNVIDQLVDGTFSAAALSGSMTSPTIDVATPVTRRQILGFKSVGRVLDPTEANQTAVAGVTVVEQVNSNLRVRQGLTTNLATVITRTPSVVLTIHHVQQTMRRILDPFIGQKLTGALPKSVETSMTGAFSNLITAQIVSTVAGITATVDEDDPTILRSEAIYVPIFPLEFIVTTLSIRVRI